MPEGPGDEEAPGGGMKRPSVIDAVAGKLYGQYCLTVGGKAFNGDPLPDWETFAGDPEKTKQADAWRMVAVKAMVFLLAPEIDPVIAWNCADPEETNPP